MAFSGLDVACVFSGGDGFGKESLPIHSEPAWSEVVASGASSGNKVTGHLDGFHGRPLLWLRSSVDGYASIGKPPNSGASPRIPLTANKDYYVWARPGDWVAFVAA